MTSGNIVSVCTAFDSNFRFDLYSIFKFGLLEIRSKADTPNPSPNPMHIDFVADKPSLDDVHFQIRIFRSIKQGLCREI